jgi:hypothetical protein
MDYSTRGFGGSEEQEDARGELRSDEGRLTALKESDSLEVEQH